jgi:hypothetical protein
MGLFGRSYDNDYGRDYNRGGMYGAGWGSDRPNRGRDPFDRWSGEEDRPYYRSARGNYGPSERGYSMRGYDHGYRGEGRYDRNYKSQWQTDHGDPYGDRQSNTPMRVIRGEYESPREREGGSSSSWWGGNDRYDREYGAARPRSPYGRESSMERGWGMRDFGGRDRYGADFRDNRY